MGVHMQVGDYRFLIKVQNKGPALDAWHKVQWQKEDYSTLEEVFDANQWVVETNKAGDIDNILFQDDRLHSNLEFMKAIAPYVEAGSYLCVILDADPARWFFDGKQLEEMFPVYDLVVTEVKQKQIDERILSDARVNL